MNKKIFRNLSLILIVLFSVSLILAEGGDKKSSLNKITGFPVYKKFNINRISTFIKNDGESDINPTGNSGFEYPRGSGKTAIFQAGFLWGGKVDGQIRVGGSVYRQGTVPGKILNSGVPASQLIGEDPNLANVRCYRVRPDYLTGSVQNEIADEDLSEAEIRDAYEKDWNEWPAADGAPYTDVDGNGMYDRTVDIPGVPGASQTIWFVCNDTDPNQTQFMYGSLPMGIEEQVTVWGYNSAGPLGSMLFRKYKIINKSNTPITEMYVSMWNDPDLGDAADDFVGCDTTLSLTFVYNANPDDAIYGNQPASAGFDFFQGPIIPGEPTDTAIFNNQYLVGFENLPMSAHYFYINSDAVYVDPTQGQYQGSLEWYNFLQGRVGTTGEIFPDPFTGGSSKFALYGDPVAGTGWIDGQQHPPGDRRAGMVAGPFNMAAGDTQEVVVAEIAAIGANNLNSVSLLKAYDEVAQDAYDKFFVLPAAPSNPRTEGTGLDKQIILNWGSDLVAIAQTESHNSEGYSFQGYNVYQLPNPSSTKEDAVRIATYDIIDGVKSVIDRVVDPISGEEVTEVQQYGSDNGIERSILISKNFINNTPLNNGSRYYFAVTSYSIYNNSGLPDSVVVPNNLENPFVVITVVPQSPDPGVRYFNAYGDTVQGVIHDGPSDGAVVPLVVDPTKLNGNSYQVTFNDSTGSILWSLSSLTDNTVILSDQSNQSGDGAYPIVDGILVKVQGPPLQGKEYSYESADPVNLSPVATATDPNYTGGRWFTGGQHGGEIFFGGVFLEPNFWGLTSISAGEHKIVRLDFRPMASYTDLNGNSRYDIGEPYVVDDPSQTQKAFMYQTFSATAYRGFFDIPFTAWDISDPANPRQLNVVVRDRDDNSQWDLHHLTDPPDTLLPRNGDQQFNYTWILNTTYDPTGTMYGDGTGGTIDFWSYPGGGIWDAMWAIWIDDRGVIENGFGMLAEECSFTLIPNAVNTAADIFTFTAPTFEESSELAKEDVNKINVFPNPYYGVNSQEINKYERFVTINHLPDKATIRIFNLAGQLIRTIEKNDQGQFQRWDLLTEFGLPVASGLYVIYVDMPDLGVTKILKAAIIQEQQILDRF